LASFFNLVTLVRHDEILSSTNLVRIVYDAGIFRQPRSTFGEEFDEKWKRFVGDVNVVDAKQKVLSGKKCFYDLLVLKVNFTLFFADSEIFFAKVQCKHCLMLSVA